jgi:enediyne biosynthesis protein E4
LGVAAADFDGSGRQSLAIANDEMPGDLLQNVGGTFRNTASEVGTSHDSDGNVHGGMGTDWGDYDNDGEIDLAVATFQQEPKNIYRSDGGAFTDQSTRLGLTEKTLRYIAFGIKWFDADNDGWLDLMIANGHVQDNIAEVDPTLSYKQPTQLFRNREGKRLEDISQSANAALGIPIVGRGLAVGDYDNDGKMDALVVDSEGKPLLLHNVSPSAGHWLTLKLVGTQTNRNGLGARVTIKAGSRTLVRHCASDGSYMSASDSRVHFGLSEHNSPVEVTIRWAGGKAQTYPNVPIDQVVTLTEAKN